MNAKAPGKPSVYERYEEDAHAALMRGVSKRDVIRELWAEKARIAKDMRGADAREVWVREKAIATRNLCIMAIEDVIKKLQGETINA